MLQLSSSHNLKTSILVFIIIMYIICTKRKTQLLMHL